MLDEAREIRPGVARVAMLDEAEGATVTEADDSMMDESENEMKDEADEGVMVEVEKAMLVDADTPLSALVPTDTVVAVIGKTPRVTVATGPMPKDTQMASSQDVVVAVICALETEMDVASVGLAITSSVAVEADENAVGVAPDSPMPALTSIKPPVPTVGRTPSVTVAIGPMPRETQMMSLQEVVNAVTSGAEDVVSESDPAMDADEVMMPLPRVLDVAPDAETDAEVDRGTDPVMGADRLPVLEADSPSRLVMPAVLPSVTDSLVGTADESDDADTGTDALDEEVCGRADTSDKLVEGTLDNDADETREVRDVSSEDVVDTKADPASDEEA